MLYGDNLITSSSTNNELFLMLDGKSEIFSEDEHLIGTLWVGDYIGDSIILEEYSDQRCEYSVRCLSLCQVGVISKYYLKRLIESYPEWSDYFETKVAERQ